MIIQEYIPYCHPTIFKLYSCNNRALCHRFLFPELLSDLFTNSMEQPQECAYLAITGNCYSSYRVDQTGWQCNIRSNYT